MDDTELNVPVEFEGENAKISSACIASASHPPVPCGILPLFLKDLRGDIQCDYLCSHCHCLIPPDQPVHPPRCLKENSEGCANNCRKIFPGLLQLVEF